MIQVKIFYIQDSVVVRTNLFTLFLFQLEFVSPCKMSWQFKISFFRSPQTWSSWKIVSNGNILNSVTYLLLCMFICTPKREERFPREKMKLGCYENYPHLQSSSSPCGNRFLNIFDVGQGRTLEIKRDRGRRKRNSREDVQRNEMGIYEAAVNKGNRPVAP